MYADDSTIYSSALTPRDLEKVLNEELVLKWVNINKMVLNIKKTKCILCSKRGGRVEPKLHLKLDDKEIKQVTEVKLLGVLIDSQMTWTSQID